MSTRNLSMESSIVASPDDPEVYRVYHDWLNENGSPLGELGALQVAAEAAPWDVRLAYQAAACRRTYLGQRYPALQPHYYEDPQYVEWRWGFIKRIHLGDMKAYTDFAEMAEQALALLRDPVCAFVQEVQVYDDACEGLSFLPPLKALRKFAYRRNDLRFDTLREYDSVPRKYVDLSPLEQFAPSVEDLTLGYMDPSDLWLLCKWTGLRRITFWELIGEHLCLAKIVDSLTRLEHLGIPGCFGVSDVRPWIDGLGQLRSLDLTGTYIDSVEPLGQLSGLRSLNLGSTQVFSLDALQQLSQLRWLKLAHTPIMDLSPIRHLTDLEYLNLSNTHVRDLRPLTSLRRLVELDLGGCEQIDDLEPLSSLTSLRSIMVYETHVQSVEELAGLGQLQTVDLGHLALDPAEVARLRRTHHQAEIKWTEPRRPDTHGLPMHSDDFGPIDARAALPAWLERHAGLYRSAPPSVLLVDVDDMRYYNDCYGMDEGNVLLARLFAVLMELAPRRAYRIYGDGFLILPENEEETQHLQQEVRRRFDELSIAIDHPDLDKTSMTVRVGACTNPSVTELDKSLWTRSRQ